MDPPWTSRRNSASHVPTELGALPPVLSFSNIPASILPIPAPETLGTWQTLLSRPYQTVTNPEDPAPQYSSNTPVPVLTHHLLHAPSSLPSRSFHTDSFPSAPSPAHRGGAGQTPLWVSQLLCETLRDFSLTLGDPMTLIMCQGPPLILPLLLLLQAHTGPAPCPGPHQALQAWGPGTCAPSVWAPPPPAPPSSSLDALTSFTPPEEPPNPRAGRCPTGSWRLSQQ